MKELVLGGNRSGKSQYAERRAATSGLAVTYVATATASDPEMLARVAQHRLRRPKGWHLVEEPIALTRVLKEHAHPDRCLLVDCLTLWLTNLLCSTEHKHPIRESAGYALLQRETEALLQRLPLLPGWVILVSNEVGLGIIPMGELSRVFADEAGLLNQKLAALCDRVTLVVAGLPYSLKDEIRDA